MTAVAIHRPMLGESGYARAAHDAYWTPEWVTHTLLDNIYLTIRVPPHGRVWEPASGKGHICRVLSARSYAVCATDIVDYGHHDRLQDFLTFTAPPLDVCGIITNPPYAISDEFVRHAIKLMRPLGGFVAMLLRNEWDSAASRTDLLAGQLNMKLVLTRRPRWSDDDKASPRHNFAWFFWDFSKAAPAEIRWGR